MCFEATGVYEDTRGEDAERRMEERWGGRNSEYCHESSPDAKTSGRWVFSSATLWDLARAAIVVPIKLPTESLLLPYTLNSLEGSAKG